MYKLYAYPSTGSTIAEAMLDIAGLPYETLDLEDGEDGPGEGGGRLRPLNPLGQVPTLVLPDGQVMTESAAITLHVADRAPEAGLVPPPDHPVRPAFLRWLVFFVANVYPTFTYGDEPARWMSTEAAQAELRQRTNEYREMLWRMVEAGITPAPWVLGDRFSALDIYVSVMSRWRPRRPWFVEHCPKLHGIALAVDRDPRVAKVWARNFK